MPNILTVPAVALSAHQPFMPKVRVVLEVALAVLGNSIGRRNTLSRRFDANRKRVRRSGGRIVVTGRRSVQDA